MTSVSDKRFKKRTAHFIAHWGVPNEIYCRDVFGFKKFAIVEFRPSKSQWVWRYATNGMSEYIQRSKESSQAIRTELYCTSNDQCPWAIDLLAAIASYPLQHHTFFGEFDTLDIGQPMDQRASPFTGIMLTPPEDPTLGAVDLDNDVIFIHRVVGLYESETDHAITRGGKALYSRLMRSGVSFQVDQWRPCTSL
jgi:hypothetical protein